MQFTLKVKIGINKMSRYKHWPTGDIRSFHLTCDQLSISET